MMKQRVKKSGFTPTPVLPSLRFFETAPSSFWKFPQYSRQVMRSVGAVKQWQNRCRGFTLIELLVTISIFLVMTSVVLARYRSYSVNADFANAVENIVLALREAQVYGSGSKAAGETSCGGSAFNCAYGVNFVNGGTSYVVFVDADVDGMYSSDEAVQTNNFPSGITATGILPASPLNVVFKRPFPDAIINNDPINNISASITVSDSKSDKSQTITISSTGMISVQ